MSNSILVICDLDGTLADTRADLAAAVNRARADCGLDPLDVDVVTSFVGDGVRKLIERAFRGTECDIDAALAAMKRHYRDVMLDSTVLYPTVVEGLEILAAAGAELAVVSNKAHEYCHTILDALGVAEFFSSIKGGGCDGLPLKPAPDMLLAVAEERSVDPSLGWVVGDNHTDIASGQAAGMRTCFAKYGFGHDKGLRSDLTVDSFAEFAESALSKNLRAP